MQASGQGLEGSADVKGLPGSAPVGGAPWRLGEPGMCVCACHLPEPRSSRVHVCVLYLILFIVLRQLAYISFFLLKDIL